MTEFLNIASGRNFGEVIQNHKSSSEAEATC